MSMKIRNFRFVKSPPLVAYFDLEMQKWGVIIFSIALFEKDGIYNFKLPGNEYVTKSGETKRSNFFRFKDASHWNIFQKMVLDQVESHLNSLVK